MCDYTADQPNPSNEIAARLRSLVSRMGEADRSVERLESELKTAEAHARHLREVEIPEAMRELGTDLYRLPDGTVLSIENQVKAYITTGAEDTVDNRPAAYEWLEQNGHGGLIKRTILVPFNKDEEAAATELRSRLSKEFSGVRQDVSIHAQTLTAWARRRLEAGEEVPDCISTHVMKVAKVK